MSLLAFSPSVPTFDLLSLADDTAVSQVWPDILKCCCRQIDAGQHLEALAAMQVSLCACHIDSSKFSVASNSRRYEKIV